MSGGDISWADYDSDGDLDIMLLGNAGSASYAILYENTGDGFTEVNNTPFEGSQYDSQLAWEDYDNDGDPDLFMCGYPKSGRISTLYQNNQGSFSEVYAGSFTPVASCTASWQDYNNDGYMDLMLTGILANNSGSMTKLYHNTGSGLF